MSMVSQRCSIILLTGAPLPTSLAWGEDELTVKLLPCFSDHFKNNLTEIEQPEGRMPEGQTPEGQMPQWRSLPLEPSHWPTGFTQPNRLEQFQPEYGNHTETSFLSTSHPSFYFTELGSQSVLDPLPSDSDIENATSQYYEQSFAIHDQIPSSQIVGPGSVDASISITPDPSSSESRTSAGPNPSEHRTHTRLHSGRLSDLKDVPNGAYLRSITPQTMTLNLVVGIISISQPRSIKPRKGGRTVELVEMLVGDETRAGFGINIWLPPPSQQDSNRSNDDTPAADSLRAQTLGLRPQDIVLLRTVALDSFRGKVYGQSLRRNMTTVDLLYRNPVDAEDRRGAYRIRELDGEDLNDAPIGKAKRVKDWVMCFVRTGLRAQTRGESEGGPENMLPSLPLDTQ